MSQKNVWFGSRQAGKHAKKRISSLERFSKAESPHEKKASISQHYSTSESDEKEISYSQLSKTKRRMADQLWKDIEALTIEQDKAEEEVWKSYERFEKFKAQGNDQEAEFHLKLYQNWSQQLRRQGENILLKLRAVQKFQSQRKVEPNIIDIQEEYLKFGPSDDE